MEKLTPIHFLKASLLSLLVLCTVQFSWGQGKVENLPKEKQTTSALYVTSKEAYKMWENAPENIKILDVRTAEEYLFIGHAAMAWNVTLFFQSYEWDVEKKHFPMKPNPDFLTQIKEVFKPSDTILVTCRSGGRSAMAVNQLAKAGYKNVYNIIDGFEGDKVKDTKSVFVGERRVNGWKNSGLPYTYHINPELMKIITNN